MKIKIGDKLPDAKVFIFETDPKEVSIKKIIAGEKTINLKKKELKMLFVYLLMIHL